MSLVRKDSARKKRRALRVRRHVKAVGSVARVSVFRSLKYMYAQIIDDVASVTLASCSSLELSKIKGNKKEIAKAVGLELAKRALDKGIAQAYLDRGRFLYHGRVQELVQGLREGGLQI